MTERTSQIAMVTGASNGYGAMAVRALARAGHRVYAGLHETMRRTTLHGAPREIHDAMLGLAVRAVELDVTSDASVGAGIDRIVAAEGRLDVIVHVAGHLSFGPAEAFTPEQFAQLYDLRVLGAQRVNRAALPQMRRQSRGLLVWVSSSSARGAPPFLAPHVVAGAALDSLAVSYAAELTRWGIETSIVVAGDFSKGSDPVVQASLPADKARAAEYSEGPYWGVAQQALMGLAALERPDADAGAVAKAIVRVVEAPFGTRPFRIHIDPAQDGAEVVNAVADRVRAEMLRRIGLEDLLAPRDTAGVAGTD